MTVTNEWDLPIPEVADQVPDPAPADGRDDEAPWGRTSSGKPRRKPGPKPGTKPAAPKPRAASSAPRKPKAPDYRTGVLGIIQLVAAPLVIAGRTNPVAMADAAALTVHAEALADGCQAVAESDARVAALLDRVLQVGPYAALIAPVVALGTQLAVNHGLVPTDLGQALGAAPPDVLIAHVTGQPAPPAAA